ncbi:MAG: energy-coupling factor transporter ATPase [Lachnospiraceae bacterium]|nr:energy-coupling factor transporter ATPase [Lachnospiraceae bacterium]
MSIIRTQNLTYDYIQETDEGGEQKLRALEAVSLDVKPGEFVAILGHNGSGKSTLAKHINALLLPSEGTVWIDGEDTRLEEKLLQIRQTAGMVFQNPDNQIIASVVEEDVGFGPENMGIPTEEILRRVDAALTAVGMQEKRKNSPNRLSGGQKQRVAIAGVLAMKPRCIVLDEATAMLDPRGRKEVLDTVSRLNKEEGITILLITHYMEEVERADRVIVMDGGHVVMTGTPREIFAREEELTKLRLTVPQVTELGHLLRKQLPSMPDCVLTAQELAEAMMAAAPEAFAAGRAGKAENAAGPAEAGGAAQARAEEKTETPAPAPENAGADAEAAETAAPPDAADRPLLALEHVSYVYDDGTPMARTAVNDVSLEIRKGEFIGLLGHTGSGKSTLIQQLNGLLAPTSGHVYCDGQDVHAEGYSLRSLRRRVGLVFQYPEHQLFESDVLADVAFGPKNLGLSKEEAQEKARLALRQTGLREELWTKSPFDLSGGQKRRVAIAGVLAMDPEILILDEPTAGLDPAGRDEILGRLRAMQEERGITVVLVSHSMEDVAEHCSRLVVLGGGTVRMDGPAEEIFVQTERLEEAHLASPQVTYCLRALREKGLDVPLHARTAAQAAEFCAQALAASAQKGGRP